jgi:hypothetical protein
VNTTEALKHGTTALADSAAHAVSELSERARTQAHAVGAEAAERLADRPEAPKHRRGRKLLLGAAFAGVAVGLVTLVRRTALGRKVEERVIDLTGLGPTDEATVERLAADGLDPLARGVG